jgi:bla regulator protein blaR1
VCHITRRDNLAAACHMIVEAIFWFHPLVWWIGSRLIDERERACDEQVVGIVAEPRAYAEGILGVCRRYVDGRLACVAGASGANLKRRVEAIMRNEVGEPLGAWRRVWLAIAALACVVLPVVMGIRVERVVMATAPQAAADGAAFEVASVRTNKSGGPRSTLVPQPGGRLTATNVTAAALIRFAYEVPAFQMFGGPDWLDSDRFDILAKAEGDPPLAQKRVMLRRLLEERFMVAAHKEMRELPIFVLVILETIDGSARSCARRYSTARAAINRRRMGGSLGRRMVRHTADSSASSRERACRRDAAVSRFAV